MTDTEAGTPLTAEERLAHLRNAVYVQQSNANVVLPTEDVKWLLDAARSRPATDPARLDEGSMQLQMHIAFCEPSTVHSTDPRATCTVLAHLFASRVRRG